MSNSSRKIAQEDIHLPISECVYLCAVLHAWGKRTLCWYVLAVPMFKLDRQKDKEAAVKVNLLRYVSYKEEYSLAVKWYPYNTLQAAK